MTANTARGPAVAIGTMRVSGTFNSLMVMGREPAEARQFLTDATARGFHVFDTAPIYARGAAEEDLGAWAPSDSHIWTKVGVDITSPLPSLDYSLDGMIKSLSSSLVRLRRDHVAVALVHNPAPEVLEDIDLPGFATHCARTGEASLIGASVLLPEVSLPIIAHSLSPGSVVMCEADQLDPRNHAMRSILDDFRLVVRSLFSGGARLRDIPGDRQPAAIAARVREIYEMYNPDAVVIGPRTVEQLAAYRPGRAWTPEAGHAD